MAQHVVLTGRLFPQTPMPAQPDPTDGAEAQAGGVSGQPPTEAIPGEAGPGGPNTSAAVAAAAAAAVHPAADVAAAMVTAHVEGEPEQAEERPAAPEAYRWEGKWYWSHTKNKQSTFAYEVSKQVNAHRADPMG